MIVVDTSAYRPIVNGPLGSLLVILISLVVVVLVFLLVILVSPLIYVVYIGDLKRLSGAASTRRWAQPWGLRGGCGVFSEEKAFEGKSWHDGRLGQTLRYR